MTRTIDCDLTDLGEDLALRLVRQVTDSAHNVLLREERERLVQRGMSLAEINQMLEYCRDHLAEQAERMEREMGVWLQEPNERRH